MSEDKENLLAKLMNEIDVAKWDLLAPHHEREALFVVNKSLELPPVGLAMTRDEVEYVRNWLTAGDIYQPTEEQIAVWKEEEVKFKYLIVQPYVLAQLVNEELQ